MNLPRWAPRTAAVVAGLTLLGTLPAGVGLASAAGPVGGPTVKLMAPQKTITEQLYGDSGIYIDPGVYIEAFGAALQFDVQRASYSKPLTISQVLTGPGGRKVLRPLPSRVLDGWNGLRRFFRLTLKNSHGKTVGNNVMSFCPDSGDPQRATPNSPADSPFPESCSTNPFTLGMVWGLQRGWGEDPFQSPIIIIGGGARPASRPYKLKLGIYKDTVTITRMWRRLLHISARDASVTVRVKVVKGHGCVDICPPAPLARGVAAASGRPAGSRHGLPNLPQVPTMKNPPSSILPDLVPLPSWGIGIDNSGAKANHAAKSFLTFAGTVWVGGHSRFDVEGFRTGHSSVMKAYQYFWKDGRVIGRARAGTMGYGGKWGHGSYRWHFAQWAQFRLLNAHKSVVLFSHKVGFCIAPTDAIDLLLPRAAWNPTENGPTGDCGSPSALWVQETLPLGWGDTYECVGGQSFNVSNLPNGTYYIEVIANPEHVIYESNYKNDVSLRKVIISGTPGHRTVRVPAYHGIDAEHTS